MKNAYYTCSENVEKQRNKAAKKRERKAKKSIKLLKRTTTKMYRKEADWHYLPWRFQWTHEADEFAESIGYKIIAKRFRYKLQNKSL